MAFPPWWAIRGKLGYLVVVFFFAAGQARNGAAGRCEDFRCANQSRIDGGCREISFRESWNRRCAQVSRSESSIMAVAAVALHIAEPATAKAARAASLFAFSPL
jgi:hypothetical protein